MQEATYTIDEIKEAIKSCIVYHDTENDEYYDLGLENELLDNLMAEMAFVLQLNRTNEMVNKGNNKGYN